MRVGLLLLADEPETKDESVICEGVTLMSHQQKLLVLPSTQPGNVLVLDRTGKLLTEDHLPICK